MKKSYFRRRSVSFWNGRGMFLLLGGILIFILIILRFAWPGAFAAVSAPLLKAGAAGSSGTQAFFDSFSDTQKLAERIRALEAENRDLMVTNETLTARINDIDAVMAFPDDTRSFALAGVLAGPPLSPYETLLLEGGEGSGIRKGALVYGAGSVPLGTIEEASHGTSRVLLYSSRGRITYGWLGMERIAITLEGAGAGAFHTTFPRDVAVAVGDLVYVPGPGAIPIGIVERITEDPSSPDKKVDIRPQINPFSVTWVAVEITPPSP